MKQLKNKLKIWMDNRLNHKITQYTYVGRPEFLTKCALNSSEQGISTEKYCNEEIIVSLTTYGRRLYEVYLAIESIMQQTMKPNRIVLWLSDEINDSDIPLILRKQQKRGLEIRYCKDILSYKKLIPALTAFPSAVIITIDDDIIYYFDLIENLFNAYTRNQQLIYCGRMNQMKLLSNNKLDKYKNWTMNSDNYDVSPLNCPIGAGGILYPVNCFNEEVFNEGVFTKICKYEDDVWFKAMALLNGFMSKKIFTRIKGGEDYIEIENAKSNTLFSMNNKGMSDIQVKAVFDKYNLYDKLFHYHSS